MAISDIKIIISRTITRATNHVTDIILPRLFYINTTGTTVINAIIDTIDIMDTTAIMGVMVIKASLYENIYVTVHQ